MWKGIKHLLLRSSTLHLNVEPTQSHTRPRIIMVKHSRVTLSTFRGQKKTIKCYEKKDIQRSSVDEYLTQSLDTFQSLKISIIYSN